MRSKKRYGKQNLSGFSDHAPGGAGFIQEAFDAIRWPPLGKNVDEFEKGVAEFVGVKSAAALNAGTAALHLAVKLAGVRRGDKVFCSDLTFSATVNPVSYEGGEQVFIDSERETWNMDPRALERGRAFERIGLPRYMIAGSQSPRGTHLQSWDGNRDICDAHGAVFVRRSGEPVCPQRTPDGYAAGDTTPPFSFNGNKIIDLKAAESPLSDDEGGHLRAGLRHAGRRPPPVVRAQEIGYNCQMSNIVMARGSAAADSFTFRQNEEGAIYRTYQAAGLPVDEPHHLTASLISGSAALDFLPRLHRDAGTDSPGAGGGEHRVPSNLEAHAPSAGVRGA